MLVFPIIFILQRKDWPLLVPWWIWLWKRNQDYAGDHDKWRKTSLEIIILQLFFTSNKLKQLKVDHGVFEKEKLVIANVYFFGWWCTMSFPSTQLVEISFFWIDNDMWRKLCYFFHVRWQHNIDLRTTLPILSPASNQVTTANHI